MTIVTEDKIQIPIPFTVPFLGITEPTTLYINKNGFQLFVRIVVFVCAGLLFWPKIRSAFGLAGPANTEEQVRDIQERIAKIEHERGVKQPQKKNVAVVTGSKEATTTSTAANAGADKAGAKRRKA